MEPKMDLLELFKDEKNIIEVKADTNVFSEGDEGTEMYVVLDGVIALNVGYEIIDIVEAGDVIGEMALIDSKSRSASALAKTDCKMVPVSKEKFLKMVQEKPDFAIHVMAVLAERIRNMNELLKK
jgi:CRP-like cAMP-binding protein